MTATLPVGVGTDPGQPPATLVERSPETVVPAPPAAGPSPLARRPRELTSADHATMAGCAASALALTWVVFARLTEGVGWFGFLVVAYLAFLALYVLVTADRFDRLVATDRLVTAVVTSGALILMAPLLWLVGYVVLRGYGALRPQFFVRDQGGVTPTEPATAGGGAHAIIGSLQQVGIALALTLPLAVSTAVFLNETRGRLRRPVRIFVDAMSGLPSIVAGLFVFAVLILPYVSDSGDLLGNNGFMASLALSMIMLPTITRTVEVVLRLVPDGLREASLALGASRARTVWSVILPTARTGIATAVVLGIARAVGETAPLLFTAFGSDLVNTDPFSGAQESLPLFVYRNIRQPLESQIDRGFTGALVLMLIVLALFVVARVIGRDRSARPARRRHRAAATTTTAEEASP